MDEKLIKSIAKAARDSFQSGDDETTIRLCNSVIDKNPIIQESTTSSKIPSPLFMLYIFKGMSLQRQALQCYSPLTDTQRISAIKTCFNVAFKIFPKSPLSLKGLISLYENCSNPPVQEYIKAIDDLLDIEYEESLLEKLIPLLPETSQRLKDILLKLCAVNGDGMSFKATIEKTNSKKNFKLLRDVLMKEETDSIEATVKKERYRLSAPPLEELRANVQRKHLQSGSLLTNVLRICHDDDTDVFIRRIYFLIPCVTLKSEKELLLKELDDLLLKCKPTPFTKAITLDLQDISDVNDLLVGPGIISYDSNSCSETASITTAANNMLNGPTKIIMEICSTKHKSLEDIRIAKEKLKEYQLNYMKPFPKRTAFLMYLEGRCLMAQRKFAEAIPIFETSIPVEDSMNCLLWCLQESYDGLHCLEDALATLYGRDRMLRLLDCLKVSSKHHLIMKSYLSLSLEDLSIEGFTPSELAHYYFLMYHHQKNCNNGGAGGDHRYLLKALKEKMHNPSCLFLLSQHYKQVSDYASQKRCLLKAFEVICTASDLGYSDSAFEDDESSFRKGDLLTTFLNDMFEQMQRSDFKIKVKKLTIDICLSISELILLSKASISLEQAEMIYSFLLDLYENMDLSCFTVDFMNSFYLSTGRLGFYLLGFSTGDIGSNNNGNGIGSSNGNGNGNGSNDNGNSPLPKTTTTLSSEIDPMLVLSFLKRCPATLENDLLISKIFEMAGMPRASLKKLESLMEKYPSSKEAVLYYVSLRITNSFFDGLDDLNYLLTLLNGICSGNIDTDCRTDEQSDALSHLEQTVAADLIFQIKIIKATHLLIHSFNDDVHDVASAAADILTGNLKATNKHQHSMLFSYYTLLFLLGNRDVVEFLEQYSDEHISSYLLLKYFEEGEGDLSLIERVISSTTNNNNNAGLTLGIALMIRGSETDIQKAEAVFKALIHNRSSFTVAESLSLLALLLLFSKTYQSVQEQRVANILRDKQCTKFPFLTANQNNANDIFYSGIMATGLRWKERHTLQRHLSSSADVDDFIKNNSIAQIQGLHGFIRRCQSNLPDTAIFRSWMKGLEKRLETTKAIVKDLPPSLLEYLDSQSTLDFLIEPQTWQNFLFYFNSNDFDGNIVPGVKDTNEEKEQIVPGVKDTNEEKEQDQKPEDILRNWLKINMKAGVFGRFGICDKETLCLIKTCFIDCIPSNLQQYLL